MAISGQSHLISALMKCFPRRLQNKVAPKNPELGKMLSEVQSQGRAGVTHRPTGDRTIRRKSFFTDMGLVESRIPHPSPQRALTAAGSGHMHQGRRGSPLLPEIVLEVFS